MSALWDPAQVVIIANPAAAGGRVGAHIDALRSRAQAALGAVRFWPTEGPDHAIALAAQAVAEGATTVLSLGGDGTHNEVVNGLMNCDAEPGALTFGVLPSGTGGDFRRALLHSAHLDAAFAALPTATATAVDVGRVIYIPDIPDAPGASNRPAASTSAAPSESRWFINIASVGIAGTTVRFANKSSKRLGGRATFAISTLRALGAYRPPILRVTVDGVALEPRRVANIFIGNSRHAGGGMVLCPEARLADGLFQVVVVSQQGTWDSLKTLPHLYNGRLSSHPAVETRMGREVQVEVVEGDAPPIDIDGESPGRAPARFAMHPGALNVLGLNPDYA